MFSGLIVDMYHDKGGQHNTPHIHAEYSGEEIVLSIEGDILKNNMKFPKAKLKMVEAWIEIHKEELRANWQLLSRGEKYFRIDPLR